MSEKYNKALVFATEKHKGQLRRGGKEYITHPVSVAELLREKGYTEDYIIAGLFHDLLEDTDATEEEILSLSSRNVLEAVKLLTKEKGYDEEDYIRRIKNNPVAFAVKGADRLHNLRCAPEADEEFRKKYIKETHRLYIDFLPEISIAVRELEESLEKSE